VAEDACAEAAEDDCNHAGTASGVEASMKDTMNPHLKRIQDRVGVGLVQLFREAGEAMIREGQALANRRLKRPGTFVEKFWFDVRVIGDNIILRFGNYHHAAKVLEFGTRKKGYLIRPVRARKLRFFKEGIWRYRRVVIHPGITGKFIVRDAFEKQKSILINRIKALIGG